jgi:hypothetical protein
MKTAEPREAVMKDVTAALIEAMADAYGNKTILSSETIDLLKKLGADQKVLTTIAGWSLLADVTDSDPFIVVEDETYVRKIIFHIENIPAFCLIECLTSFIMEYCL